MSAIRTPWTGQGQTSAFLNHHSTPSWEWSISTTRVTDHPLQSLDNSPSKPGSHPLCDTCTASASYHLIIGAFTYSATKVKDTNCLSLAPHRDTRIHTVQSLLYSTNMFSDNLVALEVLSCLYVLVPPESWDWWRPMPLEPQLMSSGQTPCGLQLTLSSVD